MEQKQTTRCRVNFNLTACLWYRQGRLQRLQRFRLSQTNRPFVRWHHGMATLPSLHTVEAEQTKAEQSKSSSRHPKLVAVDNLKVKRRELAYQTENYRVRNPESGAQE